MTPPSNLVKLLSGIRAKRGYLLPHHGLMAITAPALLDAYDAAYTQMTLNDRVLDHHDREFVWLAILIAWGATSLYSWLLSLRAGRHEH